MQAITVSDRDAGVAGLSLTDLPYPQPATNDVVVRVHAAGFIPGELDWPDTWTDRAGRDRTPSVPGHELSGCSGRVGLRDYRFECWPAGVRADRLVPQRLACRVHRGRSP